MNEVTIGNMPTLPYAVEEAVNRLRINISFLGSDIKKIMAVKSGVLLIYWHMTSQFRMLCYIHRYPVEIFCRMSKTLSIHPC